jgi:uncharacterized membrane protein
MHETTRRSLVKTVTWRVTGSSAVFVIGWIFTGNLGLAGTIALVQLVVNTVLYYFHERIWNRVNWGRKR